MFGTTLPITGNPSFSSLGKPILNGLDMWVWWVNTVYGGIRVGTQKCYVELKWMDNGGLSQLVTSMTTQLIQNEGVQFVFGPYSSTLTPYSSAVTEKAQIVTITGGASTTSLFTGKRFLYGTLSPSTRFLAPAVKSLILRGARKIVMVVQQQIMTIGAAQGVVDLVTEMRTYTTGLGIIFQGCIPSTPKQTDVQVFVANITKALENADIVVGSVYFDPGVWLIEAVKAANFASGAIVLTLTVDNPLYNSVISTEDGAYVLGAIQWNALLDSRDTLTGWSSHHFVTLFQQRYLNTTPPYQAAAYFAAGLAFTQAIEQSVSLAGTDVAFALSRLNLNTFYGQVQFDSNGQMNMDLAYIQKNTKGTLNIVIPDSLATGALINPMPTFPFRKCVIDNGPTSCKCAPTGCPKCTFQSYAFNVTSCSSIETVRTIVFYQVEECETAFGFNAPQNIEIECDYVPAGSPPGVLVQVIAYLAGSTEFIILLWIVIHYKAKVIKAAQPEFCCLISVGAIVCSVSPITSLGAMSTVKCQALPWLFHLSFSLMMGGLFVKTFRVWRIFSHNKLTKMKFTALDSLKMLVGILGVAVFLLVLWYILGAPQNTNLMYHITGVGYIPFSVCTTRHSLFSTVLVVLEVALVVIACYVSFKNRKAPEKFSETQYIMLSIYNIACIFAITRLVALQNVGKSLQVSLVGVGTSLSCMFAMCALFIPKMVRVHLHSELETMDTEAATGQGTGTNIPRTSIGALSRKFLSHSIQVQAHGSCGALEKGRNCNTARADMFGSGPIQKQVETVMEVVVRANLNPPQKTEIIEQLEVLRGLISTKI